MRKWFSTPPLLKSQTHQFAFAQYYISWFLFCKNVQQNFIFWNLQGMTRQGWLIVLVWSMYKSNIECVKRKVSETCEGRHLKAFYFSSFVFTPLIFPSKSILELVHSLLIAHHSHTSYLLFTRNLSSSKSYVMIFQNLPTIYFLTIILLLYIAIYLIFCTAINICTFSDVWSMNITCCTSFILGENRENYTIVELKWLWYL